MQSNVTLYYITDLSAYTIKYNSISMYNNNLSVITAITLPVNIVVSY